MTEDKILTPESDPNAPRTCEGHGEPAPSLREPSPQVTDGVSSQSAPAPTEETGLPESQEPVALTVAVPTAVTMWNDTKIMNLSWRTAKMLSASALVPEHYRNSPENCLVAIDLANRLGLSPIMVMQNLYVVKGKPSWSGSFCAAAINGSGRFTPLEYCFVGLPGTDEHGCYALARRRGSGDVCRSETVTMKMAAREGWLNKPGSKWQTMPVQMMMYRAAAFFARAHCSDILLGIPTYEEVQDVSGYETVEKTTVTLDPQ